MRLDRLQWLLVPGLALATPAAGQMITRVETVHGGAVVDGTTQAEEITFQEDRNDRMTVLVTLGGQGPFRFLVDTGADRTAVSRQLAGRLGLPPGPAARMHSATGASQVQTANVRDLRFSERGITTVDAPMLDANHVGADGILGTDSLRAQRVLFDFKRQVIAITPAASRARKDEEGTILVRAKPRAGRLIVTEAKADRQRLTVVLDSGSEITIGNLALRDLLVKRGRLEVLGEIELMSVTGHKLKGQYGYLKTLTMGGVDLQRVAVAFADAHTFGQMGLSDQPALLLGMNALRAFDKVSIDFASRQLRVLLPKASATDLPRLAAR